MESINHLNDEEQQKILSKQLKRHSQEVVINLLRCRNMKSKTCNLYRIYWFIK